MESRIEFEEVFREQGKGGGEGGEDGGIFLAGDVVEPESEPSNDVLVEDGAVLGSPESQAVVARGLVYEFSCGPQLIISLGSDPERISRKGSTCRRRIIGIDHRDSHDTGNDLIKK